MKERGYPRLACSVTHNFPDKSCISHYGLIPKQLHILDLCLFCTHSAITGFLAFEIHEDKMVGKYTTKTYTDTKKQFTAVISVQPFPPPAIINHTVIED